MPVRHVHVPPEGEEAAAGSRAFCGNGPRSGIHGARLVLVPRRTRLRGTRLGSTGNCDEKKKHLNGAMLPPPTHANLMSDSLQQMLQGLHGVSSLIPDTTAALRGWIHLASPFTVAILPLR